MSARSFKEASAQFDYEGLLKRSPLRFSLAASLLLSLFARGSTADEGLPITAAHANGSYRDLDNVINVLMLGNRKLKVQFDLTNNYQTANGPSAATGFSVGTAQLRGSSALYVGEDSSCRISLKFLANSQLEVSQIGEGACPFSPRTSPNGTYRKAASAPTFNPDGAPPPKLPPGSLSPTAAADLEALATTVGLDRADALSMSGLAQRARQGLVPVAARRVQLEAALKAQRTEFAKHVQAGAAAGRKLPTPGKAAPTAASGAQLAATRSEYAQALLLGDSLSQQIAELRASEDQMAKLVATVASASSEATASSKEAATIVPSIEKLVHQFDAQAKKTKAPADAQLAVTAAAKSKRAQTEASEAKGAAAAAAGFGKEALTLAALGSPGEYPARRIRVAKDDDKLRAQVADARSALAKIEASQAPKAAKPPPMKQCDLRKVDWMNYPYSGLPKLKDGGWSEPNGDGTNNWSVSAPEYFDLDGDGVAEALVPATFAYLGLTASQSPSLIVISRSSDCAVVEVGSIQGSGMCDSIQREGRKLIHEGCGEPRIEYQLIRGELKETKRTPGQ